MSTITSNIEDAISHLKNNEIVAIPTETVYGLAGNAENIDAIKKIFAMKNRPLNHPLIMHVSLEADLTQWVSFIPDYAKKLINHFWPGPLTLVMRTKKDAVNDLVTGGQDSVALRSPKHPLAQALLKRLSFPLVAPSANPFGKISPTTAEHVQDSFKNDDLLILDGGRAEVGIESTIVDATDPLQYKILRHGLIHEKEIIEFLNQKPLEGTSILRVSGKLEDHYQPEKPLYLFKNKEELETMMVTKKGKAFVLTFSFSIESDYHYQFSTDENIAAFELYYQLRLADKSKASYLAIELPPETNEWLAVKERVLKACQK